MYSSEGKAQLSTGAILALEVTFKDWTCGCASAKSVTNLEARCRSSFEEIEKDRRTRNQACVRTFLGTAAVLCQRLRTRAMQRCRLQLSPDRRRCPRRGVHPGTAAILSGLRKYPDAEVHTRALKELSDTFKSEVGLQAVDVEGRTLRPTGTAKEQYREWRKLLHELYLEENGAQAIAGALTPASPAADNGSGSAAPALRPETASPVTLDSAH